MIQGFKRIFWSLAITPGRFLLLFGFPAYFCGALLFFWPLFLPGLAALLFCVLWQYGCWRRIGSNFAVMPSIPFFDGKPYLFFYQKKQKGARRLSCRALTRSLIQDKQELPAQLPPGNYAAITHDSVLHILQKSPRVTLDAEPRLVYMNTLRHVLTVQTGGRCRRCKKRCAAWNSKARPFYLVRFSVKQ